MCIRNPALSIILISKEMEVTPWLGWEQKKSQNASKYLENWRSLYNANIKKFSSATKQPYSTHDYSILWKWNLLSISLKNWHKMGQRNNGVLDKWSLKTFSEAVVFPGTFSHLINIPSCFLVQTITSLSCVGSKTESKKIPQPLLS